MDRRTTRPDQATRLAIPNLKVGFNKVFGYYLEITNTHSTKIPGDYIRKQTVKNAERYITPELKEYEERVLAADDKARELEYSLFVELRDHVAGQAARVATNGGGAGLAGRAGGAGRVGPPPRVLPADDRCRCGAGHRRWSASGARLPDGRRGVRAQRHAVRAGPGILIADHRAEHGGQEHLHPPGGADHADGSDRQLRAGPAGHDRRGRPHLCPRRCQRRTGPGPKHVHGRDDRNGADSEYRHAQKPGDSRRNRPRNEHLRRHVAGLGRGRTFARCDRLPHAVRYALS